MADKPQVFIGYFRADIDAKETAQFLNEKFKAFSRIDVLTKSVGCQGRVGYVVATVNSSAHAKNVVRKLDGLKWKGHPLIARLCCSRSAANERRCVHWRHHVWDGRERRKGDRRRYGREAQEVAPTFSLSLANAYDIREIPLSFYRYIESFR